MLILIIVFQFIETFSWFYIKIQPGPRATASQWIVKNIPYGSAIGIENIPIYQFLPDVILKEFYEKEYKISNPKIFNYQIINANDKTFPQYVIVTNKESVNYLKESQKRKLLSNLERGGYKDVFISEPNFKFLGLFTNKRDYFISGLIQLPTSISIYKKFKR